MAASFQCSCEAGKCIFPVTPCSSKELYWGADRFVVPIHTVSHGRPRFRSCFCLSCHPRPCLALTCLPWIQAFFHLRALTLLLLLGAGHRGANTIQPGSRTGCEGAGDRPARRRCPETPGQPHQAAGELQQPDLPAGAAADRQEQHTEGTRGGIVTDLVLVGLKFVFAGRGCL